MRRAIEETSRLASLLNIPNTHISQYISKNSDVTIGDFDCCLIVGDNLDALTFLSEKYSNEIDFCYIDPPYNTGSKFIYDDKRYSSNTGIWGKHCAWMGFMLPRLVLMHNLLSERGVAAISIDDYEYAQLKILLDNIFGAENHIGTLIVNRSKNGKGSKANIAVCHEHVLMYGKTDKAEIFGLPEKDFESYTKADEHGRYKVDGLFRKKGEASRRVDRPNMFYPLYYDETGNVYTENVTGRLRETFPIDSKGVERRWLWGIEKASFESWRLYASSKGVIYVKNYLTDNKHVKIRSVWDDVRYLTERATNEINDIYGNKVFETPKPLGLIEDLIKCCTKKDDLILDFFCGTATTAHATFNVNQIDGGTRKVVLVEQDTKIESGHIALSNGFEFISDIAEYRLKKITSLSQSYSYSVLRV